MINPNLKDKVVFITGANHGIGAAAARAFALQGARVFITAFRSQVPYSPADLKEARENGIGGALLYTANQQIPAGAIVEDILSQGGTAAALEADLSHPDNIPALFDRCEQELGPVDILVNNHTYCVLETFDPDLATTSGEFPVWLVSPSEIDAHFAVNARGVALLMMEYTRRYLARGAREGSIINISTDAAAAHVANVSYAASKHAIESYTRSAACELGKYGITVNVIAPGPIQTGYLTTDQVSQISANTPLGRVGRPEDVADVILFLASQQARWLTGQLLFVGGGWRMPQ